MFFDVAVFKKFVEDCREWGIKVPIVPGLMCINNYGGFKKMTKFCKTRVPEALGAKMEALKDDADAIKEFGIEFGSETVSSLMEFGVEVLHFYTLNLEKVVYGILDKLGLRQGALASTNEKDAASMVAVGSAWARVGDKVSSVYGSGTVTEIRPSGAAVIRLESWLLAEGQNPMAYLEKGNFKKVF